jgi:hypothetical protein
LLGFSVDYFGQLAAQNLRSDAGAQQSNQNPNQTSGWKGAEIASNSL